MMSSLLMLIYFLSFCSSGWWVHGSSVVTQGCPHAEPQLLLGYAAGYTCHAEIHPILWRCETFGLTHQLIVSDLAEAAQ